MSEGKWNNVADSTYQVREYCGFSLSYCVVDVASVHWFKKAFGPTCRWGCLLNYTKTLFNPHPANHNGSVIYSFDQDETPCNSTVSLRQHLCALWEYCFIVNFQLFIHVLEASGPYTNNMYTYFTVVVEGTHNKVDTCMSEYMHIGILLVSFFCVKQLI